VTERPCYKLILRPELGDVPEINRLRSLLKALLRGYRLRCLSVEEIKPEAIGGAMAGSTVDDAAGNE
jgi:hypothetical protein